MKYRIAWERITTLLFQAIILLLIREWAGFEVAVLLALTSIIVSLFDIRNQSASKLSKQ